MSSPSLGDFDVDVLTLITDIRDRVGGDWLVAFSALDGPSDEGLIEVRAPVGGETVRLAHLFIGHKLKGVRDEKRRRLLSRAVVDKMKQKSKRAGEGATIR